ncbi:unnamed protein product [Linum trigynum]|uniref:GRF-type domain-containing protein n=1 Tax=Linum trigynum TaxID=586398 RepID=A0AAV2CJX5_9ROSI
MPMTTPFCHYGEPTYLKTSWNDANPRRRFYGCSRYGSNGACNYFRWLDPTLDERMRNVVLNFHRRIRELEKRQNMKVSKFDRKMVSVIILGAIVFSLFWTGK